MEKSADQNEAQAFGRVLRDLREERHFTQETLAFESGIDRIFIHRLELGKNQPSLKTILRLADGLGVAASEMVRLTEEALGRTPPA